MNTQQNSSKIRWLQTVDCPEVITLDLQMSQGFEKYAPIDL